MAPSFPKIANCGYESSKNEFRVAVHQAHRAAGWGLASPPVLTELAALESTLNQELTDCNQFRRGVRSEAEIAKFEARVSVVWEEHVEREVERWTS